MNTNRDPSPPRMRLRIGVSGHRTAPKLPTQSEAPLRALLDRIFATILAAARNAESDDRAGHSVNFASTLVIVSSLAEGSDRIVVEAGLAAGFGLQAFLPFARAEYARDFATPQSRATFERLLARASSVIELDGVADQRPRAYEAAGLFMLANIDLLIAIWDGQKAAGVGGTARTVSRAVADGIFVVWIDPQNPQSIQISWSGESFHAADVASVARLVKKFVAPPTQRIKNNLDGETPRR